MYSSSKLEHNVDHSDFFNKSQPIWKWAQSLPHWEQDAKIYFVTWRLSDSIPYDSLLLLKKKKEEFIKNYPKPWSAQTYFYFMTYIEKAIDKYLDGGYGSCYLKNVNVRQVLIDILNQKNGTIYSIIDYVIMPNHVHLLIRMAPDKTLKEVMRTLKRLSAFKINEILDRRGPLWQREHFDHLVRNFVDFDKIREYIKENPRNLNISEYHLHQSL